MHSRLVKPYPLVRIASLVFLTLLVSAWGTCNAMVNFNSCESSGQAVQIMSLSPGAIAGSSESAGLTVNGSDFTPQSQIMWNGIGLPTTFTDSHHLQTTVTQQTFDSFGGSVGGSVEISVETPGAGMGCPSSNSGSLELVID
jgi:hypothetical protein